MFGKFNKPFKAIDNTFSKATFEKWSLWWSSISWDSAIHILSLKRTLMAVVQLVCCNNCCTLLSGWNGSPVSSGLVIHKAIPRSGHKLNSLLLDSTIKVQTKKLWFLQITHNFRSEATHRATFLALEGRRVSLKCHLRVWDERVALRNESERRMRIHWLSWTIAKEFFFA